MEKEFIFDFKVNTASGICKVNISDYLIMLTELKENAYTSVANIYDYPEIIVQQICEEYNIQMEKVLCICYIGAESYTEDWELPIEGYRLIKFDIDKDKNIKSITIKPNLKKHLVSILFEKSKELGENLINEVQNIVI